MAETLRRVSFLPLVAGNRSGQTYCHEHYSSQPRFLTFLLVGTWMLLEHNYRRTAGLPRAPFGADADLDTDLQRVQHDLDLSPRSR